MEGFTIEYKPGLASIPGFRPFRFTCNTCQKPFWPLIETDPDPAGERQNQLADVPPPVPTSAARANLEAHLGTHKGD